MNDVEYPIYFEKLWIYISCKPSIPQHQSVIISIHISLDRSNARITCK